MTTKPAAFSELKSFVLSSASIGQAPIALSPAPLPTLKTVAKTAVLVLVTTAPPLGPAVVLAGVGYALSKLGRAVGRRMK